MRIGIDRDLLGIMLDCKKDKAKSPRISPGIFVSVSAGIAKVTATNGHIAISCGVGTDSKDDSGDFVIPCEIAKIAHKKAAKRFPAYIDIFPHYDAKAVKGADFTGQYGEEMIDSITNAQGLPLVGIDDFVASAKVNYYQSEHNATLTGYQYMIDEKPGYCYISRRYQESLDKFIEIANLDIKAVAKKGVIIVRSDSNDMVIAVAGIST